jgi:hypothetical protein
MQSGFVLHLMDNAKSVEDVVTPRANIATILPSSKNVFSDCSWRLDSKHVLTLVRHFLVKIGLTNTASHHIMVVLTDSRSLLCLIPSDSFFLF